MRTAASNAVHPFLVAFTAVMLSACGASNQRAEAPAPAEPVARVSPAEVLCRRRQGLGGLQGWGALPGAVQRGAPGEDAGGCRSRARAGAIRVRLQAPVLAVHEASARFQQRQRSPGLCGRLDAAGPGDTGWTRAAQKALPAPLVEALRTGVAPTERDEDSFFSQLPSEWLVEAANATRKTK